MILLAYVAFSMIFLIGAIGLTFYRHIVNVLRAEILRRKSYGKEEKAFKEGEETEEIYDED